MPPRPARARHTDSRIPRNTAHGRSSPWSRLRQAERIAALEAERDRLQADLDAALGEAQRLALSACRHPAATVDGGTCMACGTDLW
jgi:hypothetical protein